MMNALGEYIIEPTTITHPGLWKRTLFEIIQFGYSENCRRLPGFMRFKVHTTRAKMLVSTVLPALGLDVVTKYEACLKTHNVNMLDFHDHSTSDLDGKATIAGYESVGKS